MYSYNKIDRQTDRQAKKEEEEEEFQINITRVMRYIIEENGMCT